MKYGISGATGKMGRTLIRLIEEKQNALVFAFGAPEEKAIGTNVPGFPDIRFEKSRKLEEDIPDIVIDFSLPEATLELLDHLLASGFKGGMVIGTTGFDGESSVKIEKASKKFPIFQASNMSYGIAVMRELVGRAKKLLPDLDVEIMEIHHNAKKDSPSGTAMSLRRDLGKGRTVHGREGVAPRSPGDIGVMALRGGDVVGEHTVYFFGEGERIEITHRATNRDIFAHGALRAAEFLGAQTEGMFGMDDLLELDK